MVGRPVVHPASTSVAQLKAFFADDHVHMALLVDGRQLVGIVERADLETQANDNAAARDLATLDGRTISPDAPTGEALTRMRRARRRRLAVVNADGALVGLLCLKAAGDGFCSDQDVAARRHGSTLGSAI